MNVKLFKNHSEYSDMRVKPCVSHCIQDNKVHYNPSIAIIDPVIDPGTIGWGTDPREGNMS